jgi:adenine-specific DNA methylase
MFNPRQLLTLVTYVEIINEAKEKIREELGDEKLQAIATYLAMVCDRCVDKNCRLAHWIQSRISVAGCSGQHSLNLFWNYPEINGSCNLWQSCKKEAADDYVNLCGLLGTKINSSSLQVLETHTEKAFQINSASADSLLHLANQSMDAVVTDPPYYSTIQYAELSDFFYVWQKRILGDIFPELYYTELTDKDREAVANPSRFRDMGISPKELADRDYEAKMQSAFGEYYRVLKDNGVMTVQFNHKDSGAWDVLAQSLIVAGFEITASWAVSTENPQNLHQAQKNSVSSTVLLICRKRDPNAGQAWWDDLRPEVANLVEQRAPEFEANAIQGIDLYLSAFGPALNVFSRNYPILDSTGEEVRPEVAFAEARKAVANYRFRKLAQTDTAGFDPLTQWYFLAWDAFQAREFPFDDARQLALAVGGFNVADLGKTYKLLDIKSGTCKLLSPDQRYKKHAFSLVDNEFSARYLIDGLHAIIAIYLEEQTIEPVRRFMKATGLVSNEMFMRAWEVALRVIPHISDPRKRIPEEKALADLWLAMDEIKAKVSYVQPEIDYASGQMGLDLDIAEEA